MANKKNRKLKVYRTSGYKYENTPTIILKGKWLADCGFDIGEQIDVQCGNQKIIIDIRKDV